MSVQGEMRMEGKRGEDNEAATRRRRVVIITVSVVVVVLVVVVVAVTLGVTLGQPKESRIMTFEETFITRCNQFKGNNCDEIWSTFKEVYVGRNACKVPPDAYNPLFDLVPMNTPCNKTMFWSKTKGVVHDFTKARQCFVTLEDTVLGGTLDSLTWCGKEGSNDTITDSCPGWGDPNCENNPVVSFWTKASARFAAAACGNTSVMMNGSISSPFNESSTFGKVEVPELSFPRVQKLTVVLVTPENPQANCTEESLQILRQKINNETIEYECKEVSEARLMECVSNTDISCTSCW